MGETDFGGGVGDFREPSGPGAVNESSDGLHRRTASAGASSDSEARHEARPIRPPPPLPLHPENAPVTIDRVKGDDRSPAPSVSRISSPGEDQAPGDRPGQRGPADADRAPGTRKRGRRPQKWSIRVSAIDPQTHPDYLRKSQYPYTSMELQDRVEDIVSFCARLWARTCQDTAGKTNAMRKEDPQRIAKAA